MLQEANEDDVELIQGQGSYGGYIGQSTQRLLKKALIGSGIIIGVLSVIVLIIGIVTSKEYVPEQKWDSFRLPQTTSPLHYIMKVQPNMDNFNFTVDENIQIEINDRDTQIIFIHGVRLSLSNVKLVRSHNPESHIEPQSISYSDDYGYFELHFGQPLYDWLAHDKHFNLTLTCAGVISDVISGFYRSSYVDSNNQTQWLAVTDFEPTNAREAFIAFDEPIFKATWTISIVVNSANGWKAFSNMPIQHTSTLSDGLEEVSFERSVKMSTYLVCYVICKYDVVESTHNTIANRTAVRVLATPDTINQGHFSADFGSDVVDFFGKYFSIPYALPKLDLIAIPDFTSGAMENWGLITFRESALLFNPNVSSTMSQQRIAMIVAHEIAHQWFGNYVTMNWWDDIWLNEGFASFMEYVSVDALLPDWNMWSQFIAMDRTAGMSLDALNSSHPLATPIDNQNEILQQFDPISYNKGASVIRMLENYMNSHEANLFARGISHYLKSHAFSNAKTDDLWKALTEISGDSEITPMMKLWTTQTGFPYLEVKSDESSATNQLIITQKRFFLLETEGQEDNNTLWTIPLEVQKNSGSAARHLMKERSISISSDDFLLLNPNGTGFYRVLYQEPYLSHVISTLRSHSGISDATKAALINDAFALNTASKVSISYPLNILGYIANETSLAPWTMAISDLNRISSLIALETFYGDYRDFVLSLINNAVTNIGWEQNSTESHSEKLLRPRILGTAVNFDHLPTIQKAFDYYHSFKNNSAVLDTISGDLRGIIYRAIVQNGGEEEWDWVFNRYLVAQTPAEKDACLFSLPQTRLPYLLQRTLDLSLDTNYVRSKDTVAVITDVSANVYGKDLAWNYVKENFAELMKRYGSSAFLLNDLVEGLTSDIVTESKLKEFQDFFNKVGGSIEEGSRSITQSMERINVNIKWLRNNKTPMKLWLQEWKESQNN